MTASTRKRGAAQEFGASIENASSLRDCVREAIDTYLQQLDGHATPDLYRMVMQEVEAPLFEVVLEHTQHNYSKAAATLGMSRGTLRKKLQLYGLE
jgi:Fis family transcriptional regulator